MSLRTTLALTTILSIAGFAGSASAATVATFADPTMGPNPSMFQWNATTNTLTAGWVGQDLNLLTPGTLAPDYMDVKFSMTPLAGVVAGSLVSFGAGAIQFTDSVNNPIFRIEFLSASMLVPQGFGASEFVGNGVSFSGAALGMVESISNEAFAFGFANLVQTQGQGFEATAAFTSSADIVIPTPGALALLASAGLIGMSRRRR